MTRIIGLTGGIGSGKTLVANYMASKGIPVYIADEEAKNLMQTEAVISLVRNGLGDAVIIEGKIDRRKLAQQVFDNPEQLQKLNRIIHPLVKKHFENWLGQHTESPLIVKEAAILFESGSYKDCDAVITVTAPLEVRLQRVMQRDNTDRQSVLDRMKNQWSDEKKIERSDFVIHNISVEDSKNQVDNILKILKNQQY